MLIAEFTIDHPVLLEPLTSVPGIEVIWEETYESGEGAPQMLYWLRCDDMDAADAALAADDAVRQPEVLADLSDRRLYRVTFTDLGTETNLMPELLAVGAVLQAAVGTNDGWTCRARFPDREALTHVYRFCYDRDIPFTLDRLYDQAGPVDERGKSLNLTEKQFEALTIAYEGGYFEVPKGTTLDAVAAELGVTKQAASTRIRRGLENVLGHTLFED